MSNRTDFELSGTCGAGGHVLLLFFGVAGWCSLLDCSVVFATAARAAPATEPVFVLSVFVTGPVFSLAALAGKTARATGSFPEDVELDFGATGLIGLSGIGGLSCKSGLAPLSTSFLPIGGDKHGIGGTSGTGDACGTGRCASVSEPLATLLLLLDPLAVDLLVVALLSDFTAATEAPPLGLKPATGGGTGGRSLLLAVNPLVNPLPACLSIDSAGGGAGRAENGLEIRWIRPALLLQAVEGVPGAASAGAPKAEEEGFPAAAGKGLPARGLLALPDMGGFTGDVARTAVIGMIFDVFEAVGGSGDREETERSGLTISIDHSCPLSSRSKLGYRRSC